MMTKYYTKTVHDLFFESGLDDVNMCRKFDKFGIKFFISIYCTPGRKFKADEFKKNLQEVGLDFLYSTVLYNTLESWRDSLYSKGSTISSLSHPTSSTRTESQESTANNDYLEHQQQLFIEENHEGDIEEAMNAVVEESDKSTLSVKYSTSGRPIGKSHLSMYRL
jgi:hypothetical protein